MTSKKRAEAEAKPASVWDWDPDEVDEEYLALQRKRRAEVKDRPKRTVLPPNAEPPSQTGSIKRAVLSRLKPKRVVCSGSAVVRYPNDDPDESRRGQPILDEDGKRQYRPCANTAMKGQQVCQKHGGKAPLALARAEDQLREARNPLMASLLNIALDERLSVPDRHRAITWALERTGFKGGLEISAEIKPWERVVERMAEEDREEFLAWREEHPWFGTDSPDRTDVIKAKAEVEQPPLSIGELRAAVGTAQDKYGPPAEGAGQQRVNAVVEERLRKRVRGRRESEFGGSD